MTSLKSAKKRRQQLHARDVRGLVAFCFIFWKKKWSTNRFFRLFFRCKLCLHDKHAGLLKIYFKPMVKKLKFSTLVAESDLRFKYSLKVEEK